MPFSILTTSYPLLEDSLMKNIIVISFSATTSVEADMYCDMNNRIITVGMRR